MVSVIRQGSLPVITIPSGSTATISMPTVVSAVASVVGHTGAVTGAQIAGDPAMTGMFAPGGTAGNFGSPQVDAQGNSALAALRAFLECGQGHGAVLIHGDSTTSNPAGDTNAWPYQWAQLIAAANPNLTIRYRCWPGGSTPTLYNAPVMVQSGAGGFVGAVFQGPGAGAGGCGYVNPVAASFPYLSGYGDVTGDLDIAVKVAPTAWPVSANGATLAARYGQPGNAGWRLFSNTDGTVRLNWSPDGTAQLTAISSVAAPAVAGTPIWIRATLKLTGGALGGWDVTFYTGVDGATWTQLGTVQSNASATSIHQAASENYTLGARTIGTAPNVGNAADFFAGTFYEIQLRQGIGGPTITPVSITEWILSSGMGGAGTVPVLTGGPVLDIVAGAWPSHNINDYIANSAAMTPHLPYLLTLLNDSHNEGSLMGPNLSNTLDKWWGLVTPRAPYTALGIVGQNPQTAPVTTSVQYNHALRHAQFAAWVSRNRGTYVDIWKTIVGDPRWNGLVTGPLMNVDGTGKHLSPAGYALWAAEMMRLVNRA